MTINYPCRKNKECFKTVKKASLLEKSVIKSLQVTAVTQDRRSLKPTVEINSASHRPLSQNEHEVLQKFHPQKSTVIKSSLTEAACNSNRKQIDSRTCCRIKIPCEYCFDFSPTEAGQNSLLKFESRCYSTLNFLQ